MATTTSDAIIKNSSTLNAERQPMQFARTLQSNVQWTLLGYLSFGVCQWLMLIVVARMGLPEMVGQFALSMAVTTPIILLIGLDLRTVQATDQSNRYPFEDFFFVRVVTLLVAMSVIMGFTVWAGYKKETSLLILVMGTAKCIEALSDLCHGALQQHERLDQMAKARILRGVLSIVVLAAGLYAFQSLLLATICLASMWGAILLFYDWPVASRLLHAHGRSIELKRFRPRELWQLLVAAIPTGILSCQSSLEQNLPRLYIEGYLGERELGIYSAVSSLTIAGMMVINAAHCAALPRASKYLVNQQWHPTWQLILKLAAFGAALGVLGIAAAFVGGSWFLGMAFGSDYATRGPVLVVLMVGATIRYATLPLTVGFRAAQHFWLLAVLQTVSLVAAIPVLMYLVQQYREMGAAYASVVVAILFAVIQVPAAALYLRSHPGRSKSGETDMNTDRIVDMQGAA